MKLHSLAFIILAIAGCSTKPIVSRAPVPASPVQAETPKPDFFLAAPSRIDKHIDTASIEDYIIALPKFAYHEESERGFWERVRSARKAYAENQGKGNAFLFVKGDGCWPSKEFILDRASRTLTVRIYEWEPGLEDTIDIHTMRRVPGGWIRGSEHSIKKPEQSNGADAGVAGH